jgi:hypothetical protein
MVRKPKLVTAEQAEQDALEALRQTRAQAYERVEELTRELRVAQQEAQRLNFDYHSAKEKADLAAWREHDADSERIRKAKQAEREVKRAELIDLGVRF